MVWFLVDDKLHSNTKIREVLAEDPAALALWTVAGSWCADELNGGFIPDTQLSWLLPAGAEKLAQVLVTKRLWRRVRGGYQFHQWATDGDGSKRNPTKQELAERKRAKVEAGRKGGLASGKTRSKREARASPPGEAKRTPLPMPFTSPEGGEAKGGASATLRDAPRSSPPTTENPAVAPPAELLAELRAQLAKPKTRRSPTVDAPLNGHRKSTGDTP